MEFDWHNPDYRPVFAQRVERLRKIREKPDVLPALRRYYRDHPIDFINDWGCTFDPRNIGTGRPAVVPFILFPRQVEWCEWVLRLWQERKPGVSPKSRESGVSWLAVSLSATLCLFNNGMVVGFGSRKEEYVDKIGAPKSLFWKGRKFVELLPPEFRGGFDLKNDAPHMRMLFRQSGSTMVGEAGDNIGRGDRASIYFVDESDFLEHPETTDAALSQTTNCKIEISTPNGLGRPFHRKVTTWPADQVFYFHWRDDPRKDQAWYDKQVGELDPVTVAQELDIDFAASVEGVLIPSKWVNAAIGAAEKLGVDPSGQRTVAFDVADEGVDANAAAVGYGIEVQHVEEWQGKGDDIFGSTQRVFAIADDHGAAVVKFDSDGLGAGVRGDARIINEQREATKRDLIDFIPFRGSQEVFDPLKEDVKGRKNKDYFKNRKAQSWWHLRTRFQETYRAVVEGEPYDPSRIISLSAKIPPRILAKLASELSQPTWSLDTLGKIIIDKAPDGARSPNLADSVMILYGRATRPPMVISAAVLESI